MSKFHRFVWAPEGTEAGPAPSPAPAPAAPAPTAPSTAPSSPPSEVRSKAPTGVDDPEIAAIFAYDPFAPKNDKDPPDPASAAPTTEVKPETPPAPPAAPPAPQVGNEQVVEALHGLRQDLRQKDASPPGADPADVLPAYDFQVPEQLLAMLNSEVPQERSAGVAMLLKGAGQAIHKTVVDQLRREVAQVVPHLVRGIITQHSQGRDVQQDFYGKYRALANPRLRPMIQNIGREVAATRKAQGWSPELRDAIAEEAYKTLGWAWPPQAATAPTTILPPRTTGNGARPPAVNLPSAQQDILDTIFG